MFKRFLPKGIDFFNFFEEHIELSIKAAKELTKLSNPDADIPEIAKIIKEYEHAADKVTHQCVKALRKTFITPFDRLAIQDLITKLDDIIDTIDEISAIINFFEIKKMRSEVSEFTRVILEACIVAGDSVRALRNLKNEHKIKRACIALHRYENDGDQILRTALKRLFEQQPTPEIIMDIIKWNEIFKKMELVTDYFQDVADIVQGIVLEAS